MENIDKLKVISGNKRLEHQLRVYKGHIPNGSRFINDYYKRRFDMLQNIIYKAIEKGEIIYED